jgi:hypothetical protein
MGATSSEVAHLARALKAHPQAGSRLSSSRLRMRHTPDWLMVMS